MGSIDEADRAVEVLHDQPFMGREMIVNGAKSKGPVDGDSEEYAIPVLGNPRRLRAGGDFLCSVFSVRD